MASPVKKISKFKKYLKFLKKFNKMLASAREILIKLL